MKEKIGIICASDQEVEPFLPMIKNSETSEKAMLKFYSGTMEGVEVVTLFCGVCKTNAALATQILIDTYGCNVIINAGVAGGIAPNVKLFDTVISTEAGYWDMTEDILTDFHPWMKSIYIAADPQLVALAKRAVEGQKLPDVHFGRMITGEAFIADEHRDEINERFHPLCVDMETGSIAHVCYVNRIPYLAVRAITDTAEHEGKEHFEQNCEKASRIAAGVVQALLREMTVK